MNESYVIFSYHDYGPMPVPVFSTTDKQEVLQKQEELNKKSCEGVTYIIHTYSRDTGESITFDPEK